MSSEDFSKRLQILRSEKNLTQEHMADILNIKRQTYGYYEKEEGSRPDFNTLIKLAKYFNVSTDYLLGTTDVRNCTECLETNAKDRLTPDEERVLQLYQKLTERNKGKAELLIEQLLEKQELETAKTETTAKKQNKKEVG